MLPKPQASGTAGSNPIESPQPPLRLPGAVDATRGTPDLTFPKKTQTDEVPGEAKKADQTKAMGSQKLTPSQQEQVKKLEARDREVREHEAAHLAAAGDAVAGGASYTYQLGPDDKLYAIGGEVPVSMSSGRTPEETRAKAEKIRAAALAPDDPSGQDMAVAAEAEQMEAQATQQILDESKATANQASAAYGHAGLSPGPNQVNNTA